MKEQTYNRMPLVSTFKTPEDIVGRNNMPIFQKHYEICSRTTNSGDMPIKALNKEIGLEDRERIAEAYRELRENGFYPGGLHNGRIVWRTALKGDSQILFEKDLAKYENMTITELQKTGRTGYLDIISSSKVANAEDYEINHQQEMSK